MESMTGYAFVEKSTPQFSYAVEIKSLNAKFLETYVNLPRVLRNEENEMNSRIKKSFIRGKIELNIELYDWTETRPVSLNAGLLKKYYHELAAVHRSLKIREPLKFESLLVLEGVSQREKAGISPASLRHVYGTLAEVIRKAVQMRKAEGAATRKDLVLIIDEIEGMVQAIRLLSRGVVKERQALVRKRIEALAGARIEDTRMLTELAILADKLDINEEIVRLTDHVKKFRAAIRASGQVGRKLDFLAQEMFREVNTIGSKSNSTDISHIVVEIKNGIEKTREQCRNVV